MSTILYTLLLLIILCVQRHNCEIIQSGLRLEDCTISTLQPTQLNNTGGYWTMYLYFNSVNLTEDTPYTLMTTSQFHITLTKINTTSTFNNAMVTIYGGKNSYIIYISDIESIRYVNVQNIANVYWMISVNSGESRNVAGSITFNAPTNITFGSLSNSGSVLLQSFIYYETSHPSPLESYTSSITPFFEDASIYWDFTESYIPESLIINGNYRYITNIVHMKTNLYTNSNVSDAVVVLLDANVYIPILGYLKINNAIIQIYCRIPVKGSLSCIFYSNQISNFFFGEYDIYYSKNNVSYSLLPQRFIYINIYTLLPNSSTTYVQPFGLTQSTNVETISNTTVYIFISFCGFLLSVLLIIAGFSKCHKFEDTLSKFDYLRLNIREKYPIDDSEYVVNPMTYDTRNIKNSNVLDDKKKFGVGLSYKVHRQTTILGGIFTLLCVIISTFLVSVYLIDTVNNNTKVQISSGVSNGATVNTSGKSLNVTIFYSYMNPYFPCTNEDTFGYNIGACSSTIQSTNTQPTSLICESIPSELDYYNHCIVHMYYNKTFKSTTSFNLQYYNILYTNVTISIDSYKENELSKISTIISDKINFPVVQYIEYTLTPVMYTYYNKIPTTGYVLDFVSNAISQMNTISNFNVFSTSVIYIDITLNNNWLFSDVGSSTTNIIILAQCFAIIGGVFSIGRILVQILCHEIFRRFLFTYTPLRYTSKEDKKEKSFDNMNTRSTIKSENVDTIRESMSYVQRINHFEHVRTNSVPEMNENAMNNV
jgi:hypothetical protein